ncbi:MAG: hypothetical protein V4844_14585 [Pseudomonadota bacterium]
MSALENIEIDFSMPVPVPTLARAAGIDPARLQGRARRLSAGLVDAPQPPPLGGRFAWVTGPSAQTFLAGFAAIRGLYQK